MLSVTEIGPTVVCFAWRGQIGAAPDRSSGNRILAVDPEQLTAVLVTHVHRQDLLAGADELRQRALRRGAGARITRERDSLDRRVGGNLLGFGAHPLSGILEQIGEEA